MEKLKFPVFKGKMPEKSPLSMDDYLEFVTYNLSHRPLNRFEKKERRAMMVKVPFVFK